MTDGLSARFSDDRYASACGLLLLSLIVIVGCRKQSDTVGIQGRVTFRGQPLPSGSISFFPEKGRPVAASAVQGDYSVELLPGNYTVIVEVGNELPAGFKEGDPIPPPKTVLPDEYTTRSKSTLKAAIQQGQTTPVNFDLQ